MARDMTLLDLDLGSATMLADGTIVLRLRPEGEGMMGDTEVVYPPGHERYDAVFERLGGLRPGETRPLHFTLTDPIE